MRKNRVFTFFLLALVAFTSCREEQKQTPSSYPTMTVKKESRNLDSRYSAAIRGRQDIEIYPQVGGTLQQLLVTEGQRVSKGQVLFVIDQVPYRAALNTAEADVKTAQSALATARITYEGRQRLLEQKVISDFDMQKAANELASAERFVVHRGAQSGGRCGGHAPLPSGRIGGQHDGTAADGGVRQFQYVRLFLDERKPPARPLAAVWFSGESHQGNAGHQPLPEQRLII